MKRKIRKINKKKKLNFSKNIFIAKNGTIIKMRSSWEIKVAYWLEYNNIRWEYESFGFKTGAGAYWPDFYIEKDNPFVNNKDVGSFIEVKGRWMGKAKAKVEQFRLLYPHIELIILEYKDLKKIGLL